MSNDRLIPTARFIDIPSPRTAALSCTLPGAYHYGYQVWELTTATQNGICIMSRRGVRVGDPVYRPKSSSETPRNAWAMVLAVAIEQIREDYESLYGRSISRNA